MTNIWQGLHLEISTGVGSIHNTVQSLVELSVFLDQEITISFNNIPITAKPRPSKDEKFTIFGQSGQCQRLIDEYFSEQEKRRKNECL